MTISTPPPLTLDSAVEIRELSGPEQNLFCGGALKSPPAVPLVGVSREAIPASSGRAREKPQRSTEPIAVLAFDLDNCKEINDRFGHAEGDRLLKTFGETAIGFLRRSDCLVRVGADEFLALLWPADEFTAQTVAEWVRRALEEAASDLAAGTAIV